MSKKNLHIKKYLIGKLPEPEVQAGDAWAQMNDRLGQTSVTDPHLQNAGKFKHSLKYGLGLLSAVIIIAGIWLLIPENPKSETKPNPEKKNQDRMVFNDAPEDRKIHIRENPSTGKDSLSINAASIENTTGTDSVWNATKRPDTKNQVVRPGSTSNSEITLSATQKNTPVKKNDVNKSKLAVAKSDHVENTLNKRINTRITSNRISERNRRNERLAGLKEIKSGHTAFEKTFDPIENQPAYFKEKNNFPEKINEINSAGKILFSVKKLVPKSARFLGPYKNRIVRIPARSESKKEENKPVKSRKPWLKTFHAGLEWNATTSFKNTKYIFSGADSLSKPYLLLIPGIWISKELGERQSLTLSFLPYQSYFGGNKLIYQRSDSIFTTPKNTKMIKAVGLNFSLQYHYKVYSNWAISGGFGYSKFQKALFQENLQNYAGKTISASMVTLKKPDLINFLQTNSITFKTGILFNPGRFQAGVNLIVPLTDVSVTSTPLKTLNGQLFFRFRIK